MLKRLKCVFVIGDIRAAVRDTTVIACRYCAQVASKTSLDRAEIRCDSVLTLNVTTSVQRARGKLLNLSVVNWSFDTWLNRATDGITLSNWQ